MVPSLPLQTWMYLLIPMLFCASERFLTTFQEHKHMVNAIRVCIQPSSLSSLLDSVWKSRLLIIFVLFFGHFRLWYIRDQASRIQVQKWNVFVCQVSGYLSIWVVNISDITLSYICQNMLSMPQNYLCLQASLLHHFGTKRWLLECPHSDPGGLDYRTKRFFKRW